MLTRKLFFYLSEFLGVNFRSKFGFKVVFILFVHVAFTVDNFQFIKGYRLQGHTAVTIYTLISYFQNETFIFIQVWISVRAFLKRKSKGDIFKAIHSDMKVSDTKSDTKFLLQVGFLVLVRVLKTIMISNPWKTATMEMMVPELALASNDFMFVYFVSSLKVNLKNLKLELLRKQENSSRTFYDGVFHNLQTKRDLEVLYSTEMFLTIFYNFLQLVIALYFACLKIVFKYIRNFNGKSLKTFQLKLS